MKLSIVIPTYNRGYIIERALKSILSQSFENTEVIVVDDGSTDNTSEIIKKLQKKDKRIVYKKLQPNQGFFIARNEGVKLAKGDWICFLDSDDEYLPGALSKMSKELQAIAKTANIAFFNLQLIAKQGEKIQVGFRSENKDWRRYYASYEEVLFKTGVIQDVHRCIKMAVAKKYPYPNYRYGFETYYFAILAKAGIKCVYINETVANVYLDCNDQMTFASGKKRKNELTMMYKEHLKNHYDIFKKYPPVLAAQYFTVVSGYKEAGNPLFIWWLCKSLWYNPKYFYRKIRGLIF